jgi:hypothetical protein
LDDWVSIDERDAIVSTSWAHEHFFPPSPGVAEERPWTTQMVDFIAETLRGEIEVQTTFRGNTAISVRDFKSRRERRTSSVGLHRLIGPRQAHDRTLVGGPTHPDARRTRPLGSIGGGRPGAVPGRAAAADLGAEVGVAGPRQPANRNRAVPLTYEQFRYAFANAVSEDEAKELYDTFAVPASGAPLFQAATANLNPWTEAKVDTENPKRGPLLIISGEKDHTVPWAIANASYKKQKRNEGLTEIVEIPNRGHALTIDSGWREVADKALAFVQRFTNARESEPARSELAATR